MGSALRLIHRQRERNPDLRSRDGEFAGHDADNVMALPVERDRAPHDRAVGAKPAAPPADVSNC